MTGDIDLDAYFARIGYSGPRDATLATLRAIHLLQPSVIPFENLDPLMGRRVSIDAASVERKLIHSGRGGYCYEVNGLFARVLRMLGFRIAGLSARVSYRAPEGAPRTHMVLKVETEEGPFIADVGFGGPTLSGPLALDHAGEQETPHGTYRLVRHGIHFENQVKIDGEWTPLYRFSLEEQMPKDYEVTNWYHSTNPDSPFTKRLMVSRFEGEKRLGLFDNQFSIHHRDGRTERRTLKNAEEIAEVLATRFQINLPEPRSEVLQALARVAASS